MEVVVLIVSLHAQWFINVGAVEVIGGFGCCAGGSGFLDDGGAVIEVPVGGAAAWVNGCLFYPSAKGVVFEGDGYGAVGCCYQLVVAVPGLGPAASAGLVAVLVVAVVALW